MRKRREFALQPEDDADGTRAHFRIKRHAFCLQLCGAVEIDAPAVSFGMGLDQREDQRPAAAAGNIRHPVDLGMRLDRDLAVHAARHDFEHSGAEFLEDIGQGFQLVFLRQRAGHDLAPAGAMGEHAAGRNAQRASLHAFAHKILHLRNVVSRRLPARRSFAHHIGTNRSVRHMRADIHGELAFAQHVEIVAEAFPAPCDARVERGAGDILDPFHQLDQPVLLTGPHRRETDAAIAHDHRRHAVPAGWRELAVPGRLSIEMGVDVDKAGGDQQAARIDDILARKRRQRFTDLGYHAIGKAHIGLLRNAAIAIGKQCRHGSGCWS